MIEYKQYNNRSEWLQGRFCSIGASEAAIILGESRFCTVQELWNAKIGIQKEEVSNELIDYGNKAEEYLRKLYELKHCDEYIMRYNAYRIYKCRDKPYITCTLDGELERISDGELGVWECKTKKLLNAGSRKEWECNIPQMYYIQVQHQLGVMGWRYAILNAELRYPDGEAEIKEYIIERNEADIEYIFAKEEQFWEYVKEKKRTADYF